MSQTFYLEARYAASLTVVIQSATWVHLTYSTRRKGRGFDTIAPVSLDLF